MIKEVTMIKQETYPDPTSLNQTSTQGVKSVTFIQWHSCVIYSSHVLDSNFRKNTYSPYI